MKQFIYLGLLASALSFTACNSNPSPLANEDNPMVSDTMMVDTLTVDSMMDDTTSADLEEGPLASGVFTATDVQLNGSHSILVEDGQIKIKMSDDFSHDSGPDLFIVLVKPEAASLGIYDYNSIPDEDKLVLGAQITQAAGVIRVIDLSQDQLKEYSTVMIQCIKWNHTYGIAPIEWNP